jgi:beta-lactamase class A
VRPALLSFALAAAGCTAPAGGPAAVPAAGPAAALAPGPDGALQSRLEALVAPFAGTAGVYVRHIGDGRTAAIRADETFPTASMVKVPILIGLFARVERGELAWRAPLRYSKEREYPGEDVLARFQDGAQVSLAELATLMCAFSDNTASLWCQELAGGGCAINAWLAEHGCAATRVNSRTEGRRDAQREHGWGQTTPREMAELLVAIRERRCVSPAADAEMERALSRSYWTGEALSAIPPWAHALSKQGAVNRSRSEVLLVDGPSGPWVLCVITKDQADESWTHGNAGFELLRALTAEVWRHFEPGHPWQPPAGSERFW